MQFSQKNHGIIKTFQMSFPNSVFKVNLTAQNISVNFLDYFKRFKISCD